MEYVHPYRPAKVLPSVTLLGNASLDYGKKLLGSTGFKTAATLLNAIACGAHIRSVKK